MKLNGFFRVIFPLLGISFSLCGCGDEATAPSKPPALTMKDVVGCWKYFNKCDVYCFDKGGGYYGYLLDSQGDIYEGYGLYSLSGFSIKINAEVVSVYNRKNLEQIIYRERKEDSLLALNADGTAGSGSYGRIALDSAGCITPWHFFTKPFGWDSLVKPY